MKAKNQTSNNLVRYYQSVAISELSETEPTCVRSNILVNCHKAIKLKL
jgi:hypothetical protein